MENVTQVGNPDIQAGGSPSGSNPSVPPQQTTNPPITRMIKVNGVEQVKTLEELAVLAQKGAAADERFQEAARMRQEAESALAVVDNLKSLSSDWNEEAFRKVAQGLGMNAADTEEAIAAARANASTTGRNDADPGVRQTVNPSTPPKKVTYGDLDPTIQRELVDLAQSRQEKLIQAALEKDEVLKYDVNSSPQRRKAIADQALKLYRGRVIAAGGRVGDGAQVLQEVLQDMRQFREVFGTPEHPTPGPGLGPAPTGGRSDIYPTTEPKRVSVTDPGFEDYVSKKLAFEIAKTFGPKP